MPDAHVKSLGKYLEDLRHNRMARPQGSRPPPPPSSSISRRSMTSEPTPVSRGSLSSRSSRDGASSRCSSVLSYYQHGEDSSMSGRSSPEKMYHPLDMQRDQLQVEKQEARVIRTAMEEMDLEDEQRVVSAAREEAAELIWRHQNPDAPDPLQGSSERGDSNFQPLQTPSSDGQDGISASNEIPDAQEVKNLQSQPEKRGQETEPLRSPSKRLKHSFSLSRLANRRRSSNALRKVSGNNQKKPLSNSAEQISEDLKDQNENEVTKRYDEKPASTSQARRNPFARAHSSRQTLESSPEKPNPSTWGLNRVEIQRNPPSQSRNPDYVSNPPSPMETNRPADMQSTNGETTEQPQYKDGKEIRGEDIRAATSMRMKDRSPKLPSPTVISDKPGRPIVSFDRGWKPPENDQAQVHARPVGARPPPNPSSLNRSTGQDPIKSGSAPVVPTIRHPSRPQEPHAGVPEVQTAPIPEIVLPENNTPGESPTLSLNNAGNVPSIKVQDTFHSNEGVSPAILEPDTPSSQGDITPTPATKQKGAPEIDGLKPSHRESRISPTRPSPQHSATAPSSMPHWSPAIRTAPALCAQCALPIQGRVLTAAGTRFHPGCFVCHHCNQALECVEFFPEPGDKRDARLGRIERRMEGEDVEPPEGFTVDDDNDDSLRFYCALDFHEFFSPRCKSCKTPIEGEVIVACGAEWHVGHFFCAQCGDVSASRCLRHRIADQLSTAFRPYDAIRGKGGIRVVCQLPHESLLSKMQEVPTTCDADSGEGTGSRVA